MGIEPVLQIQEKQEREGGKKGTGWFASGLKEGRNKSARTLKTAFTVG